MAKAFPGTLLLVLFSTAAFAESRFEGYRIPDTRAHSYGASFSGGVTRLAGGAGVTSSRNGYLAGSLSIDDQFEVDSDALQWTVRAFAALGGDRVRSDQTRFEEFSPTSTLLDESRDRRTQARESLRLDAFGRSYPWPSPVGVQVAGVLQIDDAQAWSSASTRLEGGGAGNAFRQESRQSLEIWSYSESADLSAGAGYGRVRDATPVFLAMLLEERLAADGILTRALSPGARQNLAQLLSIRPDFGRVRDLPDKAFWDEVEALLIADGAAPAGGLGSRGAHHVAEPLVVATRGFTRRVGFFAGPTLAYRHMHTIRRSEDRAFSLLDDGVNPVQTTSSISSSRLVRHGRSLQLGAQVEYHRPIGRDTQLGISSAARWDMVEFLGIRGYGWRTEVSAARLLGERWLLDAAAFHSRSVHGDNLVSGTWYIGTSAGIRWYLEDQLSLQLQGTRTEEARSGLESSFSSSHDTNLAATLGVTWGRGRLSSSVLRAPILPLN